MALHNYHDKYGSFPPAFVADEHGRPMHSWRVLLLPFLEHDAIYQKYHFDEPWDGPNNRQLHNSVIAEFNCRSETHEFAKNASTRTNYVAIVGPETAWPGATSTSFKDITDGTSTTLHVVEVANSGIHWMEPRDLHVLQMSPGINSKSGQGISSKHHEGAFVLFADGSVSFLKDETPAATLQSLITAHAGDGSGEF